MKHTSGFTPQIEMPKTWPEIAGWKNRVQRQLLSKAAKDAKGDINAAAQSIDMERFHFVATCNRKGVDPKTGDLM
jgi:hypothetical protein